MCIHNLDPACALATMAIAFCRADGNALRSRGTAMHIGQAGPPRSLYGTLGYSRAISGSLGYYRVLQALYGTAAGPHTVLVVQT